MDKFYYIPCAGCGEMIDEARGEIRKWDGENGYCLYCAEELKQDCRDCRHFKQLSPLFPHDKSDMGCQHANWAGYILKPSDPPCGGIAYTSRDS